mgnify:CR=1 FL=1
MLGDVRLLGPKTLALMRTNHLPGRRDLTELSTSMFSEGIYQGVGFGLGFAVTTDPARDRHRRFAAASTGGAGWRRRRSGSTRSRT